jgi:hypothetical protein
MVNTEILKEYFIWDERNLIEPTMKLENNGVNDLKDIMTETKTVNELENWKNITDPKLRKKAYEKAYYQINKDKVKERQKVYREANKDKINPRLKAWRSINREREKAQQKVYRKNNRDKIREIEKQSYANNKNINLKLSRSLRARLRSALKRNTKSGSAVKDLGCTIDEFKIYLESKFQPGMAWDNYGYHGWHIDHIKPLASFDLSDRKQLLEACHYTNLQPLWAVDNLAKGDK